MTAIRNLATGALCACALAMITPLAHAEEVVIEVQGGPPFKFEQPNVTIKPGDTVKWVNKSGVLHTITADEDGAIQGANNLEADGVTSTHSEIVKGGARTIAYHCELHPKMKGTITVAAAPEEKAEEAPAKPKKKPKKSYNNGYVGGGYGGY